MLRRAPFVLALLLLLSGAWGAVTSEVSRNDYVGTGSLATYSWTFPVKATTELRVFRQDASGQDVELTAGVDYSTSALAANGTGSITLTAGNLANTYKLSIQRGIPYTQTVSPGTAYNAATIGVALDRLQNQIVRLKGEVDRSIKIQYLEAGGDTVTKLDDNAANRANQTLVFDSSGNVSVGTVTNATASTFAQALLDDTTASAARATLGIANLYGASFNVKDYGAVGDGSTNDSDAFQAAATALVAAGGGTILIPSGTYIVGEQTLAGATGQGHSYLGAPVISISGLSKGVRIIGSGAILKLASGLRFGSFNPTTGLSYTPGGLPFTDADYAASAVYLGVIAVTSCTGPVEISGVEIDGNMANISLGGQWGDTGYQIDSSGIYLDSNSQVTVRDCYVHHMPLDGVYIRRNDITDESVNDHPHTLINVRSEYNARQGMSITGGKGISSIRCKFNHTGRGTFASAPSAGVDIEPNTNKAIGISFDHCEMVNNAGVGFLCVTSANVERVTLTDCLLWGVSSHALWADAVHFLAIGCRIYGSTVNAYGSSTEPHKAARFKGCHFEDKKYGGSVYASGGYNTNLSGAHGVTFEDCDFVTSFAQLGSFASTNTATRSNAMRFSGCRFLMKYDGLSSGGKQILFRGTVVERCTFLDSYTTPPGSPYYVEIDGCWVQEGVVLDTSNTNWSASALYNGVIPQGKTQALADSVSAYGYYIHRSGGYTTRNTITTGTVVPASGTWVAGDVVINITPAVGQNWGWQCVSGGTPGTWAKIGHLYLENSTTYDPPSLADGAGATTTITVTGAALGDYVDISFSLDLQGISATAYVSSSNTVSVRFQNESGGVLDLASGTLRARVRKQ